MGFVFFPVFHPLWWALYILYIRFFVFNGNHHSFVFCIRLRTMILVNFHFNDLRSPYKYIPKAPIFLSIWDLESSSHIHSEEKKIYNNWPECHTEIWSCLLHVCKCPSDMVYSCSNFYSWIVLFVNDGLPIFKWED